MHNYQFRIANPLIILIAFSLKLRANSNATFLPYCVAFLVPTIAIPFCFNNSLFPKYFSADRFEYNFSSGLTFYRVWNLEKIKKIYSNIVVTKNEEGVDELTFKDKEVCEDYIDIVSKLWPEWVSDKDRTVMQFIADICKSMSIAGYLTIDDLYDYSEKEIIDKILNCADTYLSNGFKNFQKASQVYKSDNKIKDKYCVNVRSKTRYIVPLVLTEDGVYRINEISKEAESYIKDYLNIPKGGYWTYFDFDFKPYVKKR